MSVLWRRSVLPAVLLFVFGTLGFSQTPEATQILNQTDTGVISLIIYGENKEETGKGSAIVIADDLVATSYHFISKAFDANALTSKGKKIKVEGIVSVDMEKDLALVKIKGKVQPLTLGDSAGLEDGARIFAVGSNQTGQIIVSEGTLRRFLDISPRMRVMELSLTVSDEFCGAPIVNLSGQVIGILQVLDRGIRAGIPVDLWKGMPRTGKPAELKSLNREDFFGTLEGASLMGRVAAAMDEQMTARIYLENLAKLAPSSAEAHFLLADIYAKQRDFQSAADTYRKVTALDGANAEAFYGLGGSLARLMKYDEAVAALEKAISLGYEKKEIHLDLANAYDSARNYSKAAEALEAYLSLKPELAWSAYLQLGIIRMNLEQHDAAVNALLEAKKTQPEDLKVNVSLAEAYQKANRLAEAEAILNFLAKINPAEAKFYYGQAMRMYDATQNYAAAVNPARKIVELNPQDEMSVYNLGLMYFKQEKYDEAVAVFKQCLALNPTNAFAWNQVGAALYNQKKFKEAVEPYTKYTELAPDDQFGWLSLGVTFMMLKNFESALEPMRKAVDLKPDNGNALYNLAIVYLNLKDNLSARDVYQKLQSIDPAKAEQLKKYLR